MGYNEEDVPYVTGSRTSRAAANSIDERPDRIRVLSFIRQRGKQGATDDEIEKELVLRHQTASARRRGLVLRGLIEDSGRERKTRSGRNAIVWVVRC